MTSWVSRELRQNGVSWADRADYFIGFDKSKRCLRGRLMVAGIHVPITLLFPPPPGRTKLDTLTTPQAMYPPHNQTQKHVEDFCSLNHVVGHVRCHSPFSG